MTIHFKKGKKGIDILECIRKDGSSCWTKVRPGLMIHEILHYVVEMELGFQQAFYGIIAQGYAINDFEMDREKRPEALIPQNLSEEAHISEVLVGVLQNDFFQRIEHLDEVLMEIFKERNLPTTILERCDFDLFREKTQLLFREWTQLNPGETLKKTFQP